MESLDIAASIDFHVKPCLKRCEHIFEQLDRAVTSSVDSKQVIRTLMGLASEIDEILLELSDTYAPSTQFSEGTLDREALWRRRTRTRCLHPVASMPALSTCSSRKDSAISLARRKSLPSVVESSDGELYAASPTERGPSDEKEVFVEPQKRMSWQASSTGSRSSGASWQTALCLPDGPDLHTGGAREVDSSREIQTTQGVKHTTKTNALSPPGRPPPPPPRKQRRPCRPVDPVAGATKVDSREQNVSEFSSPDATPPSLIAEHRLHAIVHAWNRRAWDQAELLLQEHLRYCVESPDRMTVARVRHLLAVCASLKGDWEEAIRRFMENLGKPIKNTKDLDTGVCASAYWLGDLYAMHNRRAEALLAYCIAGYGGESYIAPGAASTPSEVVNMDQVTVRLDVSKAEFKKRWLSINARRNWPRDTSSILNPSIVRPEVVEACLDHSAENSTTQGIQYSGCRGSRLLGDRGPSLSMALQQRALMITWESFQTSSPWPLPYDPLFSIENVRIGRLIAYDCDMLAVLTTSSQTRLPCVLSLRKAFYNDISWLVTTLRSCLTILNIGHSEVVNFKGAWFMCHYHSVSRQVASTNYFSIAVVRNALRRDCFGINICSENAICSSRLARTDPQYVLASVGRCNQGNSGVHLNEIKRIRKIIGEQLDLAVSALDQSPGVAWKAVWPAPLVPERVVYQ